ncbi:MAG: glycoside hydrolase family 13 protein [Bacteroidales bacterium]|nr:glycoside hydrolase family 13 protein [Bacteroidales bacterium]
MIRILFIIAGFLILSPNLNLIAQNKPELGIEPPFWWIGFNYPELLLLVYGEAISGTTVDIRYPGIELISVDTVRNPNYLFVTLRISPETKPGSLPIRFRKGKTVVAETVYSLYGRNNSMELHQGFDPSDVIYLLMPDRFANGDTTNDNLPGMIQPVDRSDPNGRHGGDILGIINHLDYLKDLGVTSLWINPLLENNQEVYSYHGYSITNFYEIDPRFGTNQDYLKLSDEIHRRGMKLIMDMVFNHCGSNHWWMKDLPSPDWINEWPEYTHSNYRGGTVSDPYATPSDKETFVRGWFDKTMPDLNQHNPFLKNYLIQNSIWWIEYAGLDGIRQDTHPYPFKDMMAEWGKRVMDEYPDFNIVGECWLPYPASVAYWQKGARNRDGYNSNLPAVFDFPLYDALKVAFSEPDGWSKGILRLYDVLSQDFVYEDPSNIVLFADNHDINRYLDTQGDDIRKLKMAMAFILTTRGIPQIYYGTELLMTTGEDEGHGSIRKDVMGGFPGDERNTFLQKGRSPEEQDMYTWIQKVLHWRKGKEVIHSGQLRHFIPEDGIYTYFRYNETDTVMILLNNNDTVTTFKTGRFSDFLPATAKGKEIITGIQLSDLSTLTLDPKSAQIIDLEN